MPLDKVHKSTCCQWTLWRIHSRWNSVYCGPRLHSTFCFTLELSYFRCVHAQLFPAWILSQSSSQETTYMIEHLTAFETWFHATPPYVYIYIYIYIYYVNLTGNFLNWNKGKLWCNTNLTELIDKKTNISCLVGSLLLWYINFFWLFNAKSSFLQITSSISNSSV